jgi:heme exporter protein B
VSVLRAVLWKDLVAEWRSRDRLPAMLVFALLTVVVLRFAQPGGSLGGDPAAAPGLLWVAYVFAAVLGMNRAFALELENEALAGLALAPVDRGWIYLGKATANLLLLLVAQVTTALFFAVLFDVGLASVALPFLGEAFLGAVGLTAAGTLFAGISVRTRFREVMLPLLLFPLLVPLLVGAVQATAGLLAEGRPDPGALQLLGVYDGVFLIASFLLFEYVLDE